MTLIELPDLVQGSDEWLDQRRGMVTASVVGQLLTATGRVADNEHYTKVTTTGFMIRDEGTWRLGYSPDGLVGDDGLVEVKSRSAKKQLQTILADEVPAENLAQCQAGLLVSGREWLDFLSYSGGMPLFVKRVYPDQRWFDAIGAAVEQFELLAADMVAAYCAATEGMPLTERVVEQEMVI
jgi:hypothetical protein